MLVGVTLLVVALGLAQSAWASYPAIVMSDAPAAYWRFGEASGTVADDETVNANDATYLNGAALGASGALSDSTTAVALDGTNDYVRAANAASLNPTSAITLEVWVKPTLGGFSTGKPVFAKGYTSHSPPYYSYALVVADTGSLPKLIQFNLAIGGTRQILDVTNSGWQYGVWNHVVATYDGSTMRLYVNGGEVGSRVQSGAISTYATPLALGCFENLTKSSTYCFKGGVDEAAVYASALSAAEVEAHYEEAVGPSAPHNVGLPSISGLPSEGANLVAVPGTWTSAPTGYDYQWRRCGAIGTACADIAGADGASYTLVSADVGSTIRVVVTASNAVGSSDPATSTQTGLVGVPPLHYRDAVLADGPVGYWRLGEGSGTVAADASGNGLNGTYTGSPTLAVSGAASDDDAVTLSGSGGQGVNLGAPDQLRSTDAWTVEAWFKTTSTGIRRLYRWRDYGQALGLDGGKVEGFYLNASAARFEVQSAASYNDGKWHHAAVTFDRAAGLLVLYVDGVEADRESGLTSPTHYTVANGAAIGYEGSGFSSTNAFTGTLDEVAFYDAALAAGRVEAHYEWGPPPENKALPSLSGTPSVGQTLAATTGAWSGSPTSFAYQWRRCDGTGASCSDITGADGNTYLLGGADLNATLRVAVTATNNGGSTSATTAASEVVGVPPANVSLPTFSGTTTVSWLLSASPGSWDNNPTAFSYLWKRCDGAGANCIVIPDATAQTYRATTADAGKTLRVRVTAESGYGSAVAESAESATIAALTPIDPPASAAQCGGQLFNSAFISAITWVCNGDRWYAKFHKRTGGRQDYEFPPCIPRTGPYDYPRNTCGDDSYFWEPIGGFYLSYAKEVWEYFGGQLTMTSASGCMDGLPCFSYGYFPNGVPIERLRGMCGEQVHAKDIGSCLSDPVQGATGGFRESVTDLALPGIGLPFAFTRTYNSEDPTGAGFGAGWSFSYGPRLEIRANGDVYLRAEDGQGVLYRVQMDGSLEAPGALSTLTAVTGGYELVRTDQMAYEFDEDGRLTSMRDRNAQELTFAYDANGLSLITDTVGREIDVTTDVHGLITEVELPDGRDVHYGYADGRLVSVTDAHGGMTEYEYTPEGWLERIVDPNEHTVAENTYDYSGRVVSQLDALGEETTFEWDPATTTLTTTDARGKEWTDVYSFNRLAERTDPLGNTTTYEYDADFNLTSVTDARENETTMTYDARGNMLTRTAPASLSYEETLTYDAENNLLSHENGRGHTTTYDYDGDGNMVEKTEPGNRVTEYVYDPDTGLLLSVTDAELNTTTYDYDTDGNLITIERPSGAATTMDYDGSGHMTSRVDPRGNEIGADPADYETTFSYDEAGNLRTETDPLGHTTELVYDPVGSLEKVIDAKLRETEYVYDAADRLDQVIAPDDTVTDYDYDDTGSLVSRTDAELHETTYAYDDAGRLTGVVAPLGRTWTYAYDQNGNRTQTVDANGNESATAGDGTTTYTYDELNRLVEIDYSDGTPDVTFAYDANGNRTEMIDGAGTQTYVYDELDRLTSVTRGTDEFEYAYDDVGNVTQSALPGGRVVTYAYTVDGQLDTVTEAGQATGYDYDLAGNLDTTTLPSGNGYVETRAYDEAGRLVGIDSAKAGVPLFEADYVLDEVGNPEEITTLAGMETYKYDLLDRLLEVCYQASCPAGTDPFIRYDHDGVGNRTEEERPNGTTTYAYDAADRLTQTNGPGGTVAYDYDENGNQTQAGARAFAYDLANRLVSTSLSSSTTDYTYDGDGLRLEAVSGPNLADTTEYLWDTNAGLPELVRERDGSGTALRDYLYGADLVSMTVGSDPFYYLYDGIGSVANVTSETGGLQWTYDYEPYGSPRTTTQNDVNAPANLMRYTGELADPATDLYHLRARQYDPANGRFLATDPLARAETEPSISTYAYADNRPTVLIDPSGLGSVWGDGNTCGSVLCWLDDRISACSNSLLCTIATSVGGGPWGAGAKGLLWAGRGAWAARAAAGPASRVLLRSQQQLQSKFKHAAAFGVSGSYSRANAARFSAAINQHINSSNTMVIQGTLHKNSVTHYLDPRSGLNVIADPAGNFISGWKLSAAQLQNVLKHGGL